MKRFIAILLLALLTSSCQRSCSRFDRQFQSSSRNYTIEVYSGGERVFMDSVNGIINDSEGSDGIYYTDKEGYLIEISGDYILKSK